MTVRGLSSCYEAPWQAGDRGGGLGVAQGGRGGGLAVARRGGGSSEGNTAMKRAISTSLLLLPDQVLGLQMEAISCE